MPPLPRATCHECGRETPVRVDGELREHTRRPGGSEKCPGSGAQALPPGEAAGRLKARRHPEDPPADGNLLTHPAAAAFPMLSDDELRELAADIGEHGLIEPIVVRDGVVLDGRNRLRACELAGVDPEFREWEGDEDEIVAWVISKNVHRRHLTTAQRAAIAAELAKLPDGHRQVGKFADVPTQAEAAALLNVSERSVRSAREVLNASPELHDQVKRGELSVASAVQAVRGETSREARERRQRGEFPQPAPTPAPCGRPHPVNGRSCEEPEGHTWSHAYSDPSLGDESRVWWWNANDMRPLPESGAPAPAPAREPARHTLCGQLVHPGGRACDKLQGHDHAHSTFDPAVSARIYWHDEPADAGGPSHAEQAIAAEAEVPPTDPVDELGDLTPDVELEEEAAEAVRPETEDGPLPDDQRAPNDGYWTPDGHATACVQWLLATLDLGDDITVVEPSVGGGAWVRAVRAERPMVRIDRCDLDQDAPGLDEFCLAHDVVAIGDWLTTPPQAFDGIDRWDVCLGNPPYIGDLVRWLEVSLGRAKVVAYLLRETITGTETRLPFWLARRPAFICKVVPRPKWEGPGARDTSDFVDSILVVWVDGYDGPTIWDWIDATPAALAVRPSEAHRG